MKSAYKHFCLVTSEFNDSKNSEALSAIFYNLAVALLKAGHHVTIFYVNHLKAADEQMIARLESERVAFISIMEEGCCGFLPPSNAVDASFLTYQWLKDKTFDAVLFHDYQGVGYQCLKAKHQGIAFNDTSLCVQRYRSVRQTLQKNAAYIDNIEVVAVLLQEKESIAMADYVIDFGQEMLGELEALLSKPENAQVAEENAANLPLISICLTHYNRPHYLKQAIASIKQQDYPSFEVILVDDGSTEPEAIEYLNSLESVFEAKGWQIIRQENCYLGAARNNAARHAKGEYLKFMDDDNIAKRNEISRFIQVALHSKADIVTCCVQPFSGEEPEKNMLKEIWIPFGADASLGALVNSFGDANALIKKTVFDELGGFTEDYGVGHEDWEFFAKAHLAGYNIELIPEALFHYRVAPGSMQQVTQKAKNHRRNIRPYIEYYPELSSLLQLSHGLHELTQELQKENQILRDEISNARHKLDVSRDENQALRNSTSWKITKPMRVVISSIKSTNHSDKENILS